MNYIDSMIRIEKLKKELKKAKAKKDKAEREYQLALKQLEDTKEWLRRK